MQVIGICGRAKAGKSTLSKQLGGYSFPFARALKEGLIAMGIPREWTSDPNHKFEQKALLGDKTPRFAMQTLGTEWGREIMGPDFWVDLWEHELGRAPFPDSALIVVDDVRFPNEIEKIRAVGGFIVAVTRPAPERRFHEKLCHWVLGNRLAHLVLTVRQHASERLSFEEYGIPIIVNDGTPEQLLAKFRALDDAPRGT